MIRGINKYYQYIKKYNKFIIWGLRSKAHTHRYIHSHFYTTLKKLGTSVVWVDDEKIYKDIIEKNDIVISVNVAGYNLPLKKDVYYCLHNFDNTIYNKIRPSHNIRLQVYTNDAENLGEKWDKVTIFDKQNRTLYQPWGTNLLPNEFKDVVFHTRIPFVFWIGSIWNNELNQGNTRELKSLKNILKKYNIQLIHLQNIPDWLHIVLVRSSRIAPAISGQWQVDHNYLPCRMFKNISYGQLGISNVKKFSDLFEECSIKGNNIEELIEKSLRLDPKKHKEIVLKQQEVTKKHTYLNNLINILIAFENIGNI
jgi:hypothetical protein